MRRTAENGDVRWECLRSASPGATSAEKPTDLRCVGHGELCNATVSKMLTAQGAVGIKAR